MNIKLSIIDPESTLVKRDACIKLIISEQRNYSLCVIILGVGNTTKFTT